MKIKEWSYFWNAAKYGIENYELEYIFNCNMIIEYGEAQIICMCVNVYLYMYVGVHTREGWERESQTYNMRETEYSRVYKTSKCSCYASRYHIKDRSITKINYSHVQKISGEIIYNNDINHILKATRFLIQYNRLILIRYLMFLYHFVPRMMEYEVNIVWTQY